MSQRDAHEHAVLNELDCDAIAQAAFIPAPRTLEVAHWKLEVMDTCESRGGCHSGVVWTA
jgi:hypothetical protein